MKNRRLLWIPVMAMLLTTGCSIDPSMFGQGGGKHGKAADADGNTAIAQVSPTPEPVAPVPVRVEAVTRGDIETFLSTTTTLVAEESVQVLSKGTGEVTSIRRDVGDDVRAGTLLASLETEEYELQKRKAELNLRQLDEKLERTQALFDEKMASAETYQDIKFQRDNAALEVEIAELNLRNQRILAPISGVITERLINRGDFVSVNSPTFTIVDLDSIVAKVFVPERSALQLSVGQPVNLITDSIPDETFRGTITFRSPIVDSSTGTMEVKITLNEWDQRLVPGMFMRANIITDTRDDVIVVPKKAVIYDGDDRFVFLAAGEEAEKRAVTLGIEDNTRVEVTEGLEVGDQLVVIGQRGLRDGNPIEIAGNDDEEGTADPASTDEDSAPTPAVSPTAVDTAEKNANGTQEG